MTDGNRGGGLLHELPLVRGYGHERAILQPPGQPQPGGMPAARLLQRRGKEERG